MLSRTSKLYCSAYRVIVYCPMVSQEAIIQNPSLLPIYVQKSASDIFATTQTPPRNCKPKENTRERKRAIYKQNRIRKPKVIVVISKHRAPVRRSLALPTSETDPPKKPIRLSLSQTPSLSRQGLPSASGSRDHYTPLFFSSKHRPKLPPVLRTK